MEEEKKEFSSLPELYSWEHYEEIKVLRIINENLTKIPKLPFSLLKFDCCHNLIKKIEGLPASLLKFNCWGNQIKKIEGLPKGLLKFDCCHNQIKKIEGLPEGLLLFWYYNNQTEKIENIPKSLQFLNGDRYIQSSIIKDYYDKKITKKEFIENYKEKTGRNLETGLCLIRHDIMEDCVRICDEREHFYSIDLFCGWYHNKDKKCLYCGKEFNL